jgi:hypothetical protein
MIFFLATAQMTRAFTSSLRLSSSSRTVASLTRKALPINGVNGDRTMSTASGYEFTDDDRYLFDLNGYIIVRGVLSPEELKEVNAIIDRRESDMIQRDDPVLRNSVKGTALYGTGPGRKDLGKCLEWGADSKIFKSILAHPRLVPYFHGVLGKGYRMDHLPFIIAQDKGAEGFQLVSA